MDVKGSCPKLQCVQFYINSVLEYLLSVSNVWAQYKRDQALTSGSFCLFFCDILLLKHTHNLKFTELAIFKCSVQFSHSVVSDSLWPHELQYARPLCPSPTPRVHPNPCALCQWCHPTISYSVIPFSSGPQSFPAGSFQMSQLFASDGQSTGAL